MTPDGNQIPKDGVEDGGDAFGKIDDLPATVLCTLLQAVEWLLICCPADASR